ncbi:sensor histidine kinase [Paenibacillus sp. YYML68]|uniref:sensor histidine kinase n=1 Tax=Paenibacillus sp. YYML68 TaxID=2909250 RepID=UPI002490CE96|nr:histidine kinase [Paenibacillus sp. YYML68]
MKHSLARQIFVYFLIVIVLPLSIVSFISYYQASTQLSQQVENYVTQFIETSLGQSDRILQRYERASHSILSNSDVKSLLDISPEDSYALLQLRERIQNTVFRPTFILYNEINVLFVLGDHGKAIIDDNQSAAFIQRIDSKEQLEFFNKRLPDNGSIAIINRSLRDVPTTDVYTLARRIRGHTSYQTKGVLAMEIKADELAATWKDIELGRRGFFFILDAEGELIYRPPGFPQDNRITGPLISKLLAMKDVTITEQLGNEEHLLVSRKSDYSGWRVVVSLPTEELREPISTIRSTTIMVGLLALVLALILAYRFGRSIVRPIQTLKEGMRQTEKGNWQHIEQELDRQDEIGGLIHSYNLMVSRLSEMIEQVYSAELSNQRSAYELRSIELERRNAEFQALQLQINPHFLYNTLETINAYAIVRNSEEISEMVGAMAFMLRYSIQTNLEEITVANELNHVRNFMIILQHRIGREFELDVVIPPSLLMEKMVRLTLQPLVENIFQHAFPLGIEDRHWIRIDAREEDGLFLFFVEDNGAGMTCERLAEVQEALARNQLAEPAVKASNSGGIGLVNVHRRIQMVFGDQYGLSIESEEGLGTTIIMRMPKVERSAKLFNKTKEKRNHD